MNKVIIQDLCKKVGAGGEQELPADTTIRFEIKGVSYLVWVDPGTDRLVVHKNAESLQDNIVVYPAHRGAIEIK